MKTEKENYILETEEEQNEIIQSDIEELNEKLKKIIDKTRIENRALRKIMEIYYNEDVL